MDYGVQSQKNEFDRVHDWLRMLNYSFKSLEIFNYRALAFFIQERKCSHAHTQIYLLMFRSYCVSNNNNKKSTRFVVPNLQTIATHKFGPF